MLVLFDVLLVDKENTMTKPYTERRERLTKMLTKIYGRAITSERTIIDFSKAEAVDRLIDHFAVSLLCGHEGLVLKPCDAPYYSLESQLAGPKRLFIKLKKDYMHDMGSDRDVADFAVVGASYDAQQAQKCRLSNIRWTDFHLGCLINKEAVLRFDARPVFRYVGTIKQDKCIPNPELQALNDYGQFRAERYDRTQSPKDFNLLFGPGIRVQISHCFKEPFVVEVLGSSFDKPSNEDFFMLRHPRILKLHLDRTWKDTVDLEELQVLAEEAIKMPKEGEGLAMAKEVAKRMERMKVRLLRQSTSRQITQQTATPSPSTRKPPRRAKVLHPPTLVRINTAEQPDKHLLPTPPVSSPGSEPVKRVEQRQPSPYNTRKRSVDASNNAVTTSQKRLKLVQASKPKHTPHAALSEVINYALKRMLQHNPLDISESSSDASSVDGGSAPDLTGEDSSEFNEGSSMHANDGSPTESNSDGSSNADILPARMIHPLIGSPGIPIQRPAITGTCYYSYNPSCSFATSAIYLAPSLQQFPWVAQDLLPSHGAAPSVPSCAEWNPPEPLDPDADEIPESVTYDERPKLVLVERNRDWEFRALVDDVRARGIREHVAFFDWRALERTAKLEMRGIEAHDIVEAVRVAFCLGGTEWDGESGEVVWSQYTPSDEAQSIAMRVAEEVLRFDNELLREERERLDAERRSGESAGRMRGRRRREGRESSRGVSSTSG